MFRGVITNPLALATIRGAIKTLAVIITIFAFIFLLWPSRALNWIADQLAWRLSYETGVWEYWENARTGQREARRMGAGVQQLDNEFIRKGDIVQSYSGRRIVQ